MKLLVAFATAHGSTEGVAHAVAARFRRAGLDVDLRAVGAVDALTPYDAVVVGSAIHDQAWLPEAAAFVEARAAELAARPVWLFSVSSVGETSSFFGPRVARFMRRMRKETPQMAALRRATRARGHRHFAGVIERDHWPLVGDLFLRAFGGTYGDHRDWLDISAWADAIARELTTATVHAA